MSDCCNLKETPSTTDILYKQLKKEVETFMKTTNAKLLMHDGKMAELCKYLKENLKGTITELMNTMKVSGELTDIFADTVLFDIMKEIEQKEVYFEGITTVKKYDSTSKCYYYVTAIPTVDDKGYPIEMKGGIAHDGVAGSTAVESTLDFAHRKNATVCINGGVFDQDTDTAIGTTIINGVIQSSTATTDEKYQILAFGAKNKDARNYKIYDVNANASTILGAYKNAICIFGSLVLDGEAVEQTDDRLEPRQSIGFKEDGTVVIITCDGRSVESAGMTYADMARLHVSEGSFNAYSLDGGGSSSTVLRGIKQNENIDKGTVDREIKTFIYFAKDTNVTKDNNPNNDIGKVKQFLLEKMYNLVDFVKGYIRVRSPEGHYAPGIEMYVNNEASRRSKIGISFDKDNSRNSYLYMSFKAGSTENTKLFRLYECGCLMETYHGTTSERPSANVGSCFFDTTLNKPIWYNGTAWVDSTGTTV